MGMYDSDKEVYFDQYCKTCVSKDVKEHEDPCHDCLNHPSNTDSHKPVRYVSDGSDKKEKKAEG